MKSDQIDLIISGLILLGLFGHFSYGFPNRFSKKQNHIMNGIEVSPFRDKCHTEGINFLKPNKSCVFNEENVEWAHSTFSSLNTQDLFGFRKFIPSV